MRTGSTLIATFESSEDAQSVVGKVEELVMQGLCLLEVATGSYILYITFRQDDINISELADALACNGAELSFIRDPTGQAGYYTSENEGMHLRFISTFCSTSLSVIGMSKHDGLS